MFGKSMTTFLPCSTITWVLSFPLSSDPDNPCDKFSAHRCTVLTSQLWTDDCHVCPHSMFVSYRQQTKSWGKLWPATVFFTLYKNITSSIFYRVDHFRASV